MLKLPGLRPSIQYVDSARTHWTAHIESPVSRGSRWLRVAAVYMERRHK